MGRRKGSMMFEQKIGTTIEIRIIDDDHLWIKIVAVQGVPMRILREKIVHSIDEAEREIKETLLAYLPRIQ